MCGGAAGARWERLAALLPSCWACPHKQPPRHAHMALFGRQPCLPLSILLPLHTQVAQAVQVMEQRGELRKRQEGKVVVRV